MEIARYTITGGDPQCNKNFWRIIENLSSLRKSVMILGIPERVTTSNLKRLKQYHVCAFQVSLDGLKETHDQIRGVGSFDRTIEALRLLQEYHIVHNVMFTLNSQNYIELPLLINYLVQQNIETNFAFDFMVEERVNPDSVPKDIQMVTPEIAKKIIVEYHDMMKKLKQANCKVELRDKTSLNKLLTFIEKNKDGFDKNNEGQFFCSCCSNGLFGIAILPNGDVFPCRRLPISVGNLFVDSFENIYLHNEIMKKFRNRQNYKQCNNCFYFNICRGCPAVSFSYMGDPFADYPYCFLKKEISDSKEENININKQFEDELDMILHCEPNKLLDNTNFENLVSILKKDKVKFLNLSKKGNDCH